MNTRERLVVAFVGLGCAISIMLNVQLISELRDVRNDGLKFVSPDGSYATEIDWMGVRVLYRTGKEDEESWPDWQMRISASGVWALSPDGSLHATATRRWGIAWNDSESNEAMRYVVAASRAEPGEPRNLP